MDLPAGTEVNTLYGSHGNIPLPRSDRKGYLPITTPLRGLLSLATGPLNGSVIQRNIFLTSAPDQRFVDDMRFHGQGRKARLRDTESDRNLYWCTNAPEAGKRFLEEAQSYGTDVASLAENPGFTDAEKGDFRLKADAAAKKIGFQDLPIERMFKRASFQKT